MSKYTPKTEEEVLTEGLIQAGVYDFEIAGAEDAVSSKGNDMIKLSINLFDSEGKPRGLTDYLTFNYQRKLRHAADACKILTIYEDGSLAAEHFIGKTGKLELQIKKGDKKPDGGDYPDKNDVKDYIKRDSGVYDKTNLTVPTPPLDDEIPF